MKVAPVEIPCAACGQAHARHSMRGVVEQQRAARRRRSSVGGDCVGSKSAVAVWWCPRHKASSAAKQEAMEACVSSGVMRKGARDGQVCIEEVGVYVV